jgi:hypothetical protein
MLPRFLNRVFRLMTPVSRRGSIGGLVTWLKFWRKKWLSGRYFSDSTARGESSPIEPTASLPSSTMGARTISRSSSEKPAAAWRRVSSSRPYLRGSGPGADLLFEIDHVAQPLGIGVAAGQFVDDLVFAVEAALGQVDGDHPARRDGQLAGDAALVDAAHAGFRAHDHQPSSV